MKKKFLIGIIVILIIVLVVIGFWRFNNNDVKEEDTIVENITNETLTSSYKKAVLVSVKDYLSSNNIESTTIDASEIFSSSEYSSCSGKVTIKNNGETSIYEVEADCLEDETSDVSIFMVDGIIADIYYLNGNILVVSYTDYYIDEEIYEDTSSSFKQSYALNFSLYNLEGELIWNKDYKPDDFIENKSYVDIYDAYYLNNSYHVIVKDNITTDASTAKLLSFDSAGVISIQELDGIGELKTTSNSSYYYSYYEVEDNKKYQYILEYNDDGSSNIYKVLISDDDNNDYYISDVYGNYGYGSNGAGSYYRIELTDSSLTTLKKVTLSDEYEGDFNMLVFDDELYIDYTADGFNQKVARVDSDFDKITTLDLSNYYSNYNDVSLSSIQNNGKLNYLYTDEEFTELLVLEYDDDYKLNVYNFNSIVSYLDSSEVSSIGYKTKIIDNGLLINVDICYNSIYDDSYSTNNLIMVYK